MCDPWRKSDLSLSHRRKSLSDYMRLPGFQNAARTDSAANPRPNQVTLTCANPTSVLLVVRRWTDGALLCMGGFWCASSMRKAPVKEQTIGFGLLCIPGAGLSWLDPLSLCMHASSEPRAFMDSVCAKGLGSILWKASFFQH